jgi:hypothetical protein
MALPLPLSRETSTVSLQCLASATATRQQVQTPLEAVLAACHTCFLQPYVFFVSWQGVLTLAFTGFPPALIELKDNIYEACPELPPENPGSKWPKVRFRSCCCLPQCPLGSKISNRFGTLSIHMALYLFAVR